MGNARSKIVFSLEEPDSLKTLAEWLFRGEMNPDQIKHEIYATRAIGQEKITLEGHSSTVTESSSSGTTESVGEDDDVISTSSRDQTGYSSSEADSEHEAFATIYGKELASRQYRSVDEQLFLAMQRIVSQDQRYAYARTMSMRIPAAIRTPEVKEGLAREPFVQEYTHRLLENLPFALRVETARRHLAERQAIAFSHIQGVIDEPTTAKRIIRK
jgi:hypothetical protein